MKALDCPDPILSHHPPTATFLKDIGAARKERLGCPGGSDDMDGVSI